MKRSDVKQFRDIPNVGEVMEKNLHALGLGEPIDLAGKDPYLLYDELCRITRKKLDPCVLDVFISAVKYMEGGPPEKWWEFTGERKKHSST